MPLTPVVSIWSYMGRASRTDYFVMLLITSVLGAISGAVVVKGGALGFLSSLFLVGLLWVSMCACARRMHDLGRSGWWSLVALIPVANLLFALYALFAPGQAHGNEYGPSPTQTQNLSAKLASPTTPMDPSAQIHEPTVVSATENVDVITPIPVAAQAHIAEPMEEFWAQALQEFESTAMKAGLWAKAFAVAGGDERIAKATYLHLRATQLQVLFDEQQQALKVAHELELQAEEKKHKAQEAELAEVLAKLTADERAEALLPKGECPVCGHVTLLAAEQCPKCTALFTSDSRWRVKPLTQYEAIVQQTTNRDAKTASERRR